MTAVMTRTDTFEVGNFHVRLTEEAVRVSDRTPAGELCDGRADVYEVRGRGQQRFTAQDITWANGERDVRIVDRHASPKKFDDVIGRLRLSVEQTDDGQLRVDLRVPIKRHSNRRATLHQTTEGELRTGSGIDLRKVLRQHGCRQVGTRQQLLDDTSTKRNGLCAIFPADARHVPIVVHVITRLATVA